MSELPHSDDYLLGLMRRVAREIGRTPSVTELNSAVGRSIGQTHIARWGSYAAACEAGELEPNSRRGGGERRYSDGGVERAYRRIQAFVDGRVTIQGWDDNRTSGEPTSIAVRKRYGSWTKFLRLMDT